MTAAAKRKLQATFMVRLAGLHIIFDFCWGFVLSVVCVATVCGGD